MKAYLRSLIRENPDPVRARNTTREYLQARILETLQRDGAMIPLAFHGGTALRFLYALPRYSEDLDFSLENPAAGYALREYLRAIQDVFKLEGYEVSVRMNDQRTVHSAFIRFNGLLHELGLSAQSSEVLAVKIEIDTNPPGGACLEVTLVRRHVTLRLQHHDRATLLAGKLHAILQRPWIKGRDLYDLMWYLTDPGWPEPNHPLLQNALRQTGWKGDLPTTDNWRLLVYQRLAEVDVTQAAADVRPFLDSAHEADLLTLANFKRLLLG